ncbi:MAG: trypsin-like peptidase domain-containing protein [Chloroflexota bacterium]
MRQYRPLSPLRPPDPEPAPPSPPGNLRLRLKSFYSRFHNVLFLVTGILIALAAVYFYDMAQPPPQVLTQRDIDRAVERSLETMPPPPSYAAQAYENIRPSVVRIHSSILKEGGETGDALGTGVVIDEAGTILTSLHVVNDAVDIQVIFWDGSESRARLIGADADSDLAVLLPDIIPDDLLPATLASTAGLRPGDEIAVVGNPFGITNSVSSGVISGMGRSFRMPETGVQLHNLIQFDAAVNPGNSGGPLLNRDGEVIGIVTALLNPVDEDFFIGIGFAVPIETAMGAAGGGPPL